MAQGEDTRFLQQVEGVLPRKKIERWARELGVVRRQRKLDIVTFVYSLVLGFGAARSRSLSQFRRVYSRTCGISMARSSFHGRFTEPLTHLMKRLLDLAISSSGKRPTRLGGAASAFLEVLAIDSSIVRVSEQLADEWPAAWSNHTKAAVKITAVTNVVGRNLKHVRFSPGSRHDIHLLKSGPWLRNRLIVFDLGFFKAEIFKEIDAAGGYFLSRLKKQSNPVILKFHTKGLKKRAGMKLKDAQALAAGSVIDADALMSYIIKPLKHLHCTVPFRVVALYNERENTWHRYVTNAPPEKLSAENMTALYAARWEVELLFKETEERLPSRGHSHSQSRSKFVPDLLCAADSDHKQAPAAGAWSGEKPSTSEPAARQVVAALLDHRERGDEHLSQPKQEKGASAESAPFSRNRSTRSESQQTASS